MSGTTVAVLGVGAVAVGAGVYFFVIRPRLAAAKAAAPGAVPSTGGPAPAVATGTGQNIRIQPSLLSDSHVSRKDAAAPLILSKFGVPDKYTQPIASIASRLSVSGYAEKYLEKVPVVSTVTAIPSKILGGITSLF